MATNTTAMLRALADHLDRHQLDDGSIMRAGLGHSDDLDVQIYAGQDGDMRALLGAWTASMHDAHVTAEQVEASFHVHVTGTVDTVPITVTCVASGERANQVRAALGIPAVPALPTGDALLDALTMRQVA
jgi:hypothetical protein